MGNSNSSSVLRLLSFFFRLLALLLASCVPALPISSGKSLSQSMKKHQMNTLDPGAFSESFMRVLNESGGDFAVLSKSLERSDLELSKYGDRFFEVVFLGSSAQSRSMVLVEGGGRNLYAIFTGDSTEVSIQGWVTLLKKLLNLRPALRARLQDVMRRLIASLAVRGQPEMVKLAMFLAKALSVKMPGIVAKPIFQVLYNDFLLKSGLAINSFPSSLK
ncbi:unnamed protein product [Linum trigynum]|uniref:5MP1/2-like HEAT domain-containing protein n=1 Tax=Linum trigynum TaxID=586398 RepID=A0AAV2D1W9_9ROSI